MKLSSLLNFKLIGFGILLFQFSFLLAQNSGDSIPQGIIKVKRQPIPAKIQIGLVYLSDGTDGIDGFISEQEIFNDSILDPDQSLPRPLNLTLYYVEPGRMNDSGGFVDRRSDNISSEVMFNWNKYLSSLNYTFAYSDSSRSDSAQYLFSIDKKGNATCKPLSWKTADSTCRVFENKTMKYATVLTKWITAQQNKKPGSKKLKKVPCTVIVTFYAFEGNANRRLPIEDILPAK